MISAATLEKVLSALQVDVSSAEGRAAAWDRLNNGPWRSMLPSVVIARQGHEKDVQVHVPDGTDVTLWVDVESGGRVPLEQIDRYVPPRMVDGVLIGEATFAIPTDLPLGWHSIDRKSTRLNSSHTDISRMQSSA